MGTIASEKNRLHKILDDSGIRITTILSSINGVSSQLIIEGLINGDPVEDILDRLKGAAKTKRSELRKMINQPLSKPHKVVLKTILEHIKSIKAAILELETQILEILEPFKEYWKILQTIPGVGITSAASIIAEIGVDMGRFNSAKHLCAWAGMCPSNNESAGKKKSARVRKGSSFLKKTLCESANAAIRTNSQFKGKYQSLTQRRGYKRTIMAIGHKILRAVYIMFLKFTHYIDPKIDYKEQMVKRNAPRWIRALKEFGYLKGDGSLRI
jgi:transposase